MMCKNIYSFGGDLPISLLVNRPAHFFYKTFIPPFFLFFLFTFFLLIRVVFRHFLPAELINLPH